jgi:predicted O-methyltransferase YrrM
MISFISKAFYSSQNRLNDYFDAISTMFVNDLKYFLTDQESRYTEFALNRQEGIKRLNEVLFSLDLDKYDELNGMYSEHMILFAALSLKHETTTRSILEIGTWSGRFTRILSGLFPQSHITTIDLPVEADNFVSSYGRSKNIDEFLAARDENLKDLPNVRFIEINSLMLSTVDERKFDLIWVDGAHGYPVVACDIVNSLRLLNDCGMCLIDDVWDNVSSNDKMYKSIGAFELLAELADAGLIESYSLFLKRLCPKRNIKRHRKFVGAFTKTTLSNNLLDM